MQTLGAQPVERKMQRSKTKACVRCDKTFGMVTRKRKCKKCRKKFCSGCMGPNSICLNCHYPVEQDDSDEGIIYRDILNAN